jgi:hypothetical protein
LAFTLRKNSFQMTSSGTPTLGPKAKIAAAEKILDARRALFKERINMEEQQ